MAAVAMNRTVVLVLMMTVCSACSAGGHVVAPVRAQPGEGLSIAFVGDVPFSSPSGYEKGMVSCVAGAVRDELPALRAVPSRALLRALFVSSSARAEALDPLSLMLLRDDPAARRRVSAVGIRYVIALSGGSGIVEEQTINTPIAVGGMWIRRSSYSAEIYDVTSGRLTATASAWADAGGGVGFGLIPPFLYIVPTFTHSRACARLGARVVEALGGPAAPQD